MPFLLIFLGIIQTLAFQCIDMHYYGMVSAFHPLERIDKRSHVVTFPHIEIVKAKRPEKIVPGLPFGVP